jgi:hypothetical protein
LSFHLIKKIEKGGGKMIFIAGVQENLYGSRDHEWHRKPWMVQETMNGTANLDGSGDNEWYRKP